jgi:uncharacterized membrane protein YoaT (DUF817 family)
LNRLLNNQLLAARVQQGITYVIDAEHKWGRYMGQHKMLSPLWEFVRFGLKQAWACLFGAIMLALMLGTRYVYPEWMPVYRYDFLFISALIVQAALLAFKLETVEEAKVIILYHVIGTVMELFKTAVGSWIYPEPSLFRIGGVPLVSGFMYSCVGSYICRVWRLFDFKFSNHPSQMWLWLLSVLIYFNFFAHHFIPDIRIGLFILTAVLFLRTQIYFKVWHVYRSMPLLLGLTLVALFIWFAENIATFAHTWIYPNQKHGWELVKIAKLGSWFLLMIISYTLVAFINKPTVFSPTSQQSTLPS